MASACVFTTVASARTACQKLNAFFSYPSPGINAVDGTRSTPGADGWTATAYEPIRVVDTDGVYGAAGGVYFLVGPLPPRIVSKISKMANPPTVVDVPLSLFRRGKRYRAVISSWMNGSPVVSDVQEDYDGTSIQ